MDGLADGDTRVVCVQDVVRVSWGECEQALGARGIYERPSMTSHNVTDCHPWERGGPA